MLFLPSQHPMSFKFSKLLSSFSPSEIFPILILNISVVFVLILIKSLSLLEFSAHGTLNIPRFLSSMKRLCSIVCFIGSKLLHCGSELFSLFRRTFFYLLILHSVSENLSRFLCAFWFLCPFYRPLFTTLSK